MELLLFLIIIATVFFAVLVKLFYTKLSILISRELKHLMRELRKAFTIFSTRELIVKSPMMEVSISRARERSKKIDEFLGKNSGIGQKYFIEQPPGYSRAVRSHSKVAEDSFARLSANLEHEKTDEGLLLIGRVRDALIYIDNIHQLKFFEKNKDTLLITLEKGKIQGENNFPQKVVIRADYFPRDLYEKLEEIQDWLGIGVEYVQCKTKTRLLNKKLRAKAKVRSLGKCRIEQLVSGVIGGAIRTLDGRILQVTCGHVIPNTCPFKMEENSLQYNINNTIDVSLLEPFSVGKSCSLNDTFCFSYLDPSLKGCRVFPKTDVADLKYLQDLINSSGLVRKKHPKVNKVSGLIVSYTATFTIGDIIYKDHIFIEPFSKSRFIQFFYRLFNLAFSKPGHSGSWVFDEYGKWIGMVVAGRGSNSIVLPSWTILEYLANLGINFSTQDLQDLIVWY